jgi:hypothetical protein
MHAAANSNCHVRGKSHGGDGKLLCERIGDRVACFSSCPPHPCSNKIGLALAPPVLADPEGHRFRERQSPGSAQQIYVERILGLAFGLVARHGFFRPPAGAQSLSNGSPEASHK